MRKVEIHVNCSDQGVYFEEIPDNMDIEKYMKNIIANGYTRTFINNSKERWTETYGPNTVRKVAVMKEKL